MSEGKQEGKEEGKPKPKQSIESVQPPPQKTYIKQTNHLADFQSIVLLVALHEGDGATNVAGGRHHAQSRPAPPALLAPPPVHPRDGHLPPPGSGLGPGSSGGASLSGGLAGMSIKNGDYPGPGPDGEAAAGRPGQADGLRTRRAENSRQHRK